MNEVNENVQKKQKGKKTLIVAIIILLAILCVAAGLLFLKKDTKAPVMTDDQSTEEGLRESVDLENTQNVEIENKVKTNVSNKLKEKHSFQTLAGGTITIDNISLIGDANTGDTTFKFDMVSSDNIEAKAMALTFVDKDGNNINGYEVTIENIVANEVKNITLTFRDDFSNAYDFKMQM